MFTYCVTFRVADGVADRVTYDQRYGALMDNITKARSRGYWEETTSFILIESPLSTSALCADLSRGLSAAKDMLVVFDPSDMSLAYFGAVKSPDVLGSFFKTRKKVG